MSLSNLESLDKDEVVLSKDDVKEFFKIFRLKTPDITIAINPKDVKEFLERIREQLPDCIKILEELHTDD